MNKNLVRLLRNAAGGLVLAAAFATSAWGRAQDGNGVPEIDPSTLRATLAIVAGGVAILAARLRRK